MAAGSSFWCGGGTLRPKMRPPPSDNPDPQRASAPIPAQDLSGSLALPRRSVAKRTLNVLTPAAAPDLSRVRLFINEIGVSFFRVISQKFSTQAGYGANEAEQIKEGIKQLRDLGQEFIALGGDPQAQRKTASELRHTVERLFSVDPNVSGLSRQGQVAIVKSYQLFLYLVEEAQNAERELRGQARLARDPGALDPLLEQAIASWGKAQVSQALSKLSISFVFTKHPTTIKYSEMQRALSAVSNHFARQDWARYYADKGQRSFNPELDSDTIEKFRGDLDDAIASLWDLPAIRPQRPSVRSEIEEGYAELADQIAPSMAAIRCDVERRGFELNSAPIWSIKQWFGFDVDGHPFVDKECVAAALFLNNVRYLSDLIKKLDACLAKLDDDSVARQFGEIRERIQSTLAAKAQTFERLVRDTSYSTSFWYQDELHGYATLEFKQAAYGSAEQCVAELRAKCSQYKCANVFDTLISRLEMSGFSLASGMFRENSKVLELIVSSLIPDYIPNAALDSSVVISSKQIDCNQELIRQCFTAELTAAEILTKLNCMRERVSDQAPIDKALQTIETLLFIAQAQEQLGLAVIPEFILSLTENRGQMLAYARLLKCCGVRTGSRIIPLFEEYESLQEIDVHLRQFFADKELLQMLKGDDRRITVFLGMSDGQKTTGPFFPYLAADAEERILQVAREFGEDALVFYGIGSSQARGQDRHPEREYAARPSLRYAPVIERTIQGEAIQRLRPQDLSKHVGAVVFNYLRRQDERNSLGLERNQRIDLDKRAIVKAMNSAARKQFSELTLSREFSHFLGHFSAPLDSLNPASRPNNRSAKQDLGRYQSDFSDLRAVPANYQDIQAQTLLSTWYGAGAAFELAQGPILGDSKNIKLANSELLFAPDSPFHDPRFHKNIQFMIEAIASSGLDVTEAMLQLRLDAVTDPTIIAYLNSVLTKLKQEQAAVITELEKFVPNDGSAKKSHSMRARAFALLDSPLLKDDISRRLPYITVLSFVAARGLNIFDQYSDRDNEIAQFGFDLARIAAAGKANGYRQVG